MMWFEGNIADAVATSKARNALFVVFIEGSDDASQTTSAAINNAEVSSVLGGSDFVAIKLDSGSEPYRQFAQIYQVVPVPSLFFIGRDGRPLEIIVGASTSTNILKHIETVLARSKESPSGVSTPVDVPPAPISPPVVSPVPFLSDVVPQSQDSAAGQSSSFLAAERNETEMEAKDRMEKAKELIEKNRLKKLEEEKDKERERELERRKIGQEVQRLRQWQQDQELKLLKEDRDREKREETAARDRVRLQIAQDKAERAKRNLKDQEKIVAEKEVQNVPRPPASNSDTARLQLRLPDGSIITHQLASTGTLGELRAFVSERLSQSPESFLMSTTFPRRVLATSEDSQTMSELELVPTAVILILSSASGGVVRSGGSSAASAITPLTRAFWTLLTPILSIFTYVKNMLFGRGFNNTAGGANSSSGARSRQSPGPADRSGPTRRIPATSEVRRQGNSNVHRLSSARDSSDEDNNTWNGNSTQQM